MYDKIKISQYKETLFSDGVVQIRGLLDKLGIEKLSKAIEKTISKPSPFSSTIKSSNDDGSFFMDFNNWKRIEAVHEMCLHKPILDMVRSLTSSRDCWLFHDHLLVKQGKSIATPWHQDRPYYIFKGNLNLSVWMPLNSVSRSSSLLFWRGSHKLNEIYMPKSFGTGKNILKSKDWKVIEKEMIPDDEIIDFEMKKGDVIIFFNNSVHGSRPHVEQSTRKALSIRYLLEGAKLTTKYVNATPPFDRLGVKVYEDGEVPDQFPKVW